MEKLNRKTIYMNLRTCSCGSKEFLIISEKIYEGYVERGILKCAPDNEAIVEIKCRACQKIYKEKNFDKIDY